MKTISLDRKGELEMGQTPLFLVEFIQKTVQDYQIALFSPILETIQILP